MINEMSPQKLLAAYRHRKSLFPQYCFPKILQLTQMTTKDIKIDSFHFELKNGKVNKFALIPDSLNKFWKKKLQVPIFNEITLHVVLFVSFSFYSWLCLFQNSYPTNFHHAYPWLYITPNRSIILAYLFISLDIINARLTTSNMPIFFITL